MAQSSKLVDSLLGREKTCTRLFLPVHLAFIYKSSTDGLISAIFVSLPLVLPTMAEAVQRIRGERFAQGAVVQIGGISFVLDCENDLALAGCLERLKLRQCELLNGSLRDAFDALESAVRSLVVPSRVPNEPKPTAIQLVSRVEGEHWIPIARSLVFKFLAERVGLASRLLDDGSLELVCGPSAEYFTLPTSHWDLIQDGSASIPESLEFVAFVTAMDSVKRSSNEFQIGPLIYKGNTSKIYDATLKAQPCAVKTFNLGELSPAAKTACFKELYLMRELCSYPSANNGLLPFLGYYISENAPISLSLFVQRATSSAATPQCASLPLVLLACRDCLRALTTLHDNAYIHRDIKASNILFLNDVDRSQFFLADFGLSTKCGKDSRRKKKRVGSTRWMAPEVLACSGYDWRSDMWSFGMTIVELLTGKFPYHNVMVLDVPAEIQRKTMPIMTPLRFELCAEVELLQEMARQSIQWNPEDRPSAATLLARIDTALGPLYS